MQSALLDALTHPTLDIRGPRSARAPNDAVAAPLGYVLEEVIGTGGMAVVHRAREVDSGRVVALKVMQTALLDDENLLARFRREVVATSKLDHDNIVRMLAFGDETQTPFMATELVDGGSLRALMTEVGPMPPLLAAILADDLLCGLAHAHAHGLVHRDLKPANLLLTRSGRLKVNDFGIASMQGEATLSAPGSIIGTPSYMSPEQALGLPVGASSDLFSVGTVLYEMLTGINPFAHESQWMTLSRVTAGAVTPIFEIDPLVPPGLERLVHFLIEADPAARCQTAEEALTILRAARAQMTSTPETVARRIVAEPGVVIKVIRANQARADLAEALALERGGQPEGARAAFMAFRATAVPGEESTELCARLCERYGFRFREPPCSALRAFEVVLLAKPREAEVVKRAAAVARGDGDLLRAAALYKRYLRLRPRDDIVRRRLVEIVGPDIGVVLQPFYAPREEPSAGSHEITLAGRALATLVVINSKLTPVTLVKQLALLAQLSAGLARRALGRLWHRAERRSGFAGRKPPTISIVAHRAPLIAVLPSCTTPRAYAAALRDLARQSMFDDDTTLQTLLARAACSLALEDHDAALADLDASIALLPGADLRRMCLTTVICGLRQL